MQGERVARSGSKVPRTGTPTSSPALGAPASSPIQVRVGEDEAQPPSPAQVPPSTWKQSAPGAVGGQAGRQRCQLPSAWV